MSRRDALDGRTPRSRSAAASHRGQDARLLDQPAQLPCSVGGGLLQRGEEALSSLVIDDVAGALGERALSLTARRLAYELAQGLAISGRRGLLQAALLLGDPDLDPACLCGGVGCHPHSVRHPSGQLTLGRKRRTGVEPATSSLGSLRSTN